MDNLQYSGVYVPIEGLLSSFKPYYKWITFNILHLSFFLRHFAWSFKPYYKWITFNMLSRVKTLSVILFCFKPYYKWITFNITTIQKVSLRKCLF